MSHGLMGRHDCLPHRWSRDVSINKSQGDPEYIGGCEEAHERELEEEVAEGGSHRCRYVVFATEEQFLSSGTVTAQNAGGSTTCRTVRKNCGRYRLGDGGREGAQILHVTEKTNTWLCYHPDILKFRRSAIVLIVYAFAAIASIYLRRFAPSFRRTTFEPMFAHGARPRSWLFLARRVGHFHRRPDELLPVFSIARSKSVSLANLACAAAEVPVPCLHPFERL